MNYQQQKKREELISILWKLKNAAQSTQPKSINFHDLLHDRQVRSDFIDQAANSSFSEIRHAANRARELDAQGMLNDGLT